MRYFVFVCSFVGFVLGPFAAAAEPDAAPEVEVTTGGEGGSGYSSGWTCWTDPATDDEACRHAHRTSYSAFEGVSTTATSDAARRFLEPTDCAAPDRDATDQAAMWLLAGVAPHWEAGPPVEQVAVCMSLDEAESFQGGLAWWAPGGRPDVADGESWQVRYAARHWSAGEAAPVPDPSLHTVLQDGELEVFVASQAVAVYDAAGDRHAWVLNLAGGTERDDKVDRWPMIEGVTSPGDGRLEIRVHGEDAPRVVELP